MNSDRFFKTGTTLILVFSFFSAKLAAQDIVTFTWQAEDNSNKNAFIIATEGEAFTVNWGDGTAIEPQTGTDISLNINHTYAIAGEYAVTIAASTANCMFTSFECEYQELTAIDVSDCPNLIDLNCGGNQLAAIDVSDCPNLISLDCSDNQLTALDVSGCQNLIYFGCVLNQLTDLNITDCPALLQLSCDFNQLTELDLSSCPSLTTLECQVNQLTGLDLSSCPNLILLQCPSNQLTGLDLSGCSNLRSLECHFNQLTALDVSDCPNLITLLCSNNQITALDLSDCLNLLYIVCDNNQITALDLSGCSNVEKVHCFDNQLSLSDLYAVHLLVNVAAYKRLGTQNLLPQIAVVGNELFENQSVFNDTYTSYTVTQNDNPAPLSDYTVVEGKLIFNTIGEYTITMTNSAIVSSLENPAQVTVGVKVVEASTDATLFNLTVLAEGEALELTPAFDGEIFTYTLHVDYGISAVTITATQNNPNATITASSDTGLQSLQVGQNVFAITVIAEDGSITETYTVTVIRSDITGIVNFENDGELKLYPNPVFTDKLIVETSDNLKDELIQIYDFSGKLLLACVVNCPQTEMNLSHLFDGIYVVRVGNVSAKIVKQ